MAPGATGQSGCCCQSKIVNTVTGMTFVSVSKYSVSQKSESLKQLLMTLASFC